MGAEVLALFGVAMAAALADMLVPTENGSTRHFLHFLTAMVVLILLLRPFLLALGGAEGFLQGDVEWAESEESQEEYEQIFSQAVARRSAAELREGLARLLQREYGIDAEDCEIRVNLTEDGALSEVSVFLSGAALLCDPEEIAEDLQGRLGCRVEVR